MSFFSRLSNISIRAPRKTARRATSWPPVDRDWKRLVGTFAAVTVAVFAFAGYLFVRINREDGSAAQDLASAHVEMIDQGLLQKTIQAFEAKKEHLELIRQSSERIVDPSL